MKQYPTSSGHAPTSLPVVSTDVLRRFWNRPPEFELLYQRLERTNPDITQWLLSTAERIAPANVNDKQRYARLALQLYGMLVDQADINALGKFLDFAPRELDRADSSPY